MDYRCRGLKQRGNEQRKDGFTLEYKDLQMCFLADGQGLLRGSLGARETEVEEGVVAPGGE